MPSQQRKKIKERMSGRPTAYSTFSSKAVTHLSTDQALRCLTSVIEREPVYSA